VNVRPLLNSTLRKEQTMDVDKLCLSEKVVITNKDLQAMYGIKPTDEFEVQAIINGHQVFLDGMFDGDWIDIIHLQKTIFVEHKPPYYKWTIGGHVSKPNEDTVATILAYGHAVPPSDHMTLYSSCPTYVYQDGYIYPTPTSTPPEADTKTEYDLHVETSLRDTILDKTSELGWQKYVKWFALILLLGVITALGVQSAKAQQVGQMGQGRGMTQFGQSRGGSGQGQGQSGTISPAVGLNYMDFVIRRNIRRDFSGPSRAKSKRKKNK